MTRAGTVLNAESEFGGEYAPAPSLRRMVHASDAMLEVTHLIRKVAPTSASVLLVGESGTGKELSARAVHELSSRRRGPFVAVDCGAIPETLIEGELFGHEKGAYTGATQRRSGHFEAAHGGSLFLDELTSMPVASQTKLLRVLEEQSFRRLGGKEELSVDFRLIAAMNEDPERAVAEGRLREDLYYRINVVTVSLPPLRERLDDVALLVEKFVREFSGSSGKSIRGVDAPAAQALTTYGWPGNVRELRNVIERAVILTDGNRISLQDLPTRVLSAGGGSPAPPRSREIGPRASGDTTTTQTASWVGMTIDEATRRLLLDTLKASGYNKTQAARALGVSTKTIYNKLKEWARHGDPEARLAESQCRGQRSSAPKSRGRLVHLDSRRPIDANGCA